MVLAQPVAKKAQPRPKLQLELPTERVFFSYKEPDPDEGSIFYPASLFYKLYCKKEKLGFGASSIVRRFEKRCNKKSAAVKITRTRDEEIFDQIKREFKNMKDLDHRNVIDFQELYYDSYKGRVYLVMEYFKGEEMEVLVEKNGRYNGKIHFTPASLGFRLQGLTG